MEHIKEKDGQGSGRGIRRQIPTVSAVLEDGSLVETVYDSMLHRTRFIVAHNGGQKTHEHLDLPDGSRLVPISGRNNLLTHRVVLLPAATEECGTKVDLLGRLQAFIHEYVDLSPLFERIAAHYILLSWLYDGLHEMPYLRVRGEPGSGKTRFLQTVGSLCYKPIFASGASTVSPIFRMLDLVRGTLIFDEADFRFSDERAEVVKILNNGTTRGFPVLRAEQNKATGEFNPIAFHVFGPKIVATRGSFEDRALESRFISEQMGGQRLRRDIPIALTDEHAARAQTLRNQLLTFRLRNHQVSRTTPAVDPSVDPRVSQMFGPLMGVVDDAATRAEIQALAMEYSGQVTFDRSLGEETQVVQAIHRLMRADAAPPTVHAIAAATAQGGAQASACTARDVGRIVRHKLGLRTVRRRDGHSIAPAEARRLTALFAQYGLTPDPAVSTPQSPHSPEGMQPRPLQVSHAESHTRTAHAQLPIVQQ